MTLPYVACLRDFSSLLFDSVDKSSGKISETELKKKTRKLGRLNKKVLNYLRQL